MHKIFWTPAYDHKILWIQNYWFVCCSSLICSWIFPLQTMYKCLTLWKCKSSIYSINIWQCQDFLFFYYSFISEEESSILEKRVTVQWSMYYSEYSNVVVNETHVAWHWQTAVIKEVKHIHKMFDFCTLHTSQQHTHLILASFRQILY